MNQFHRMNEMLLLKARTLMIGLKVEMTGARLTNKGRTCYAQIKDEYGLKGNKQSVYEQLAEIIATVEANQDG